MTPREFQLLMERMRQQDELLKQATHDVINRIDNVTRAQITHDKEDDERFQEVWRQQGLINTRMAFLAGGCTLLFLIIKLLPPVIQLLLG